MPSLEMPTAWHFAFPFLPPGKNHRKGHRKDGGEYVMPKARSKEDRIRGEMLAQRFVPQMNRTYAMEVIFTFPTWRQDLDGPLASLVDACFSHTRDHRLEYLTVQKVVRKGEARTEVWIKEIGG